MSDEFNPLRAIEQLEDCVLNGVPPHSGYRTQARRLVTELRRWIEAVLRAEAAAADREVMALLVTGPLTRDAEPSATPPTPPDRPPDTSAS
jgi:hypothetical protein